MTSKELAKLIAQNTLVEPDWLDRIDLELLKTTCEKMSDEEWNSLDNRTIEFLGQHLLSTQDKKNLRLDVDDFLNNMEGNN